MRMTRHVIMLSFALMLNGCSTTPRQIAPNHPIIGIWDYESNGEKWSREFTTNGTCILIDPNGKAWWVFDYRPVNSTFVYVISNEGDKMPHEILSDGRLLIEKGNIGTKRK